MEIKTGTFEAENLRAIGAALPPDEPPLHVGDWCCLNSGSPSLLVVECDAENVVLAWEFGVEDLEKRRGKHWQQIKNEHTFPRSCLRRTVAGKWNVSPNIKKCPESE